MTDDPSKSEFSDLGARLKRARELEKGPASKGPRLKSETSGFGQAMRLGLEMISGVIVGVGFGWLLDSWADTKPWFMIGGFFMGSAAGFMNIFRLAGQMTAEMDAEDAASKAKNSGESADSGPQSPEK